MSRFRELAVDTSFKDPEQHGDGTVREHPVPADPMDMLKFLQVSESNSKEFGLQACVMRLCYAAAHDDVDVVRSMLERRLDPDSSDYRKMTPLHVAAGAGSEKVTKLLLERKASFTKMDSLGETPLSQAQKGGHNKIEALLINQGATVRVEGLVKKASEEFWAISRSQVQLKKELCSTFKSTVHLASWLGVDVVVKFPKGDQDKLMQQFADQRDVPLSPAFEKSRRKRPDDFVTTENLNDIEAELVHEVQLLASLRHPDLVMFLGASFEERPMMFVLEYMERGDLEQYYMAKRREKQDIYHESLKTVLRWASAVARALAFLHSLKRPIVHRDLKPLNLLLAHNLDMKVTDFGISKMATGKDFQDSYKMTGGVGTWLYMAPEVVRGQHYTEKVDIFSFALIIYFMASGRDPFWHLKMKEPDACLKEYLKGNEPRPQVSDVAAPLRTVMQAAWSAAPEERPCATELTQELAGLSGDTNQCCVIA